MPVEPVTELLQKWRQGDQGALESLIPLVYKELREIANRHLQRERPAHTLQSTALVHEAYLRMVRQRPIEANSRAHFVAIASRIMRQILVDYARGHRAGKRGSDRRVELDTGVEIQKSKSVDVVVLDDALNDLARFDEQQSRIVELRFFGGLTTEETAEVLGVSPATIKREWGIAKSWLTREMRKETRGESGTMAQD